MSISETYIGSRPYGDRMVGIWGGSVFLRWYRSEGMFRRGSPRAVMSCLVGLLIRPGAHSPVIQGLSVARITGDRPCSLIAPSKAST